MQCIVIRSACNFVITSNGFQEPSNIQFNDVSDISTDRIEFQLNVKVFFINITVLQVCNTNFSVAF